VLVTREGHQDRMTFRAELAGPAGHLDRLKADLQKTIQDILRLRGEVQFLNRGSLPKGAKKIEDKRVWE